MKEENIGSSLDDFLREEGIYEEVTEAAIKRVLARQIVHEMEEQKLTKAAMAKRMNTSRAALDRLLDPRSHAVTLSTLARAAKAVAENFVSNSSKSNFRRGAINQPAAMTAGWLPSPTN